MYTQEKLPRTVSTPYLRVACMLLATLATATLGAAASADTGRSMSRRQAGRHEHGTSTLNVAIDGNTLAIELSGPAANFIGFEHAPHTAEQTTRLASALTALKEGERLFSTPSGAECRSIKADVTPPTFPADGTAENDDEDDHAAGHEQHHEGEQHAEMAATWDFHCSQPKLLNTITVKVFTAFPGTEKLETSLIGPGGQAGQVLTADQAVIRVSR